MSARDAILEAIARAAVPPVPLPAVPSVPSVPDVSSVPPVPVMPARSSVPAQLEMSLAPATDAEVLVRRFAAALEQAGGTVVEGADLAALPLPPAGDGPRRGVVSCVRGLPISTLTIAPDAPRERLDQIGLAIVPARFGVAENGAVWVDERDLPHRAVPFIAERLVVVLPKGEIVADLHEAYRRLRPPLPGYGAFIAGPSKTADIEQALVIGAQGPKSLVVLLT